MKDKKDLKKSSSRRSEGKTRKAASRQQKEKAGDLIIVGIGASAGGLGALQKVLPGLPAQVGMAFVIVQHLAPKYHSALPSLLAKYTDMPIETITDGIQVRPDTIYITPPSNNVTFSGDRLMLNAGPAIGPKPSIDTFFKSLAEEKMAHAVGIVLSGSGTDGAHGIRAIKSNEGITMAQTAESAGFDSMPRAAIETGLVDMVLPPEKIGEGLQAALQYPHLLVKVRVEKHLDEIGDILEMVRQKTGVDYSEYKKNTIHRRISRRMAIHKLEIPGDYIHFIKSHPEELDALSKDMLISVTGFFRDPKAFESLALSLRRLLEGKKQGDTFRAWVPGCSTGEEAYSIAMLIAEILGGNLSKFRFQIFATDIHEESVQLARKAIYPVAAVVDLEERLVAKYFSHLGENVAVDKQIRDMVVMARQDLIKDTSFMHLDLISCRNLLIYINSDLQDKLLSLFHFSLNPAGILFLGKSESIGQRTDLFKTVDSRWKIFQRREAQVRGLPLLMQSRHISQFTSFRTGKDKQQDSCTLQDGVFFDSLLGMLDCCAVLTDGRANIHYVRGDVSPYFRFPEGNVKDNLNAVEMARPELRFSLQSMVHKAVKEGQTVTSNTINFDDNRQAVRIKVGPAQRGNLDGYQLIVFTPAGPAEPAIESGCSPEKTEDGRIHELEQELQFTREHLQDTIEELETSTEELQSLNEELQAANEELQATNEELETSNEELQSSNEELNTVNDELRAKSDEAAEFLSNLTVSEQRYRRLVDNMNEALMLCEIEYGPDKQPTDLIILQANRALERLMAIKSRDLPMRAGAAWMYEMVSRDLLEQFEAIARGGDSRRIELHLGALEKDLTLSVYNMGEDLLGVVCRDDTERNRAETALRRSEAKYRTIGEAIPYGVWIADAAGNCTYASASFLEMVGMTMEQIEKFGWLHLLPPEDVDDTKRHWLQCVQTGEAFNHEHRFKSTDGTYRDVLALGRPVKDEKGSILNWVGLNLDITDRKTMETALSKSEALFRVLVQSANSAILRWSNNGTITFINDYAQALFGYESEEILGSNVNILLPQQESTGADLTGLVQDIVEHPQDYLSNVNENVCRDGRRIWINWTNKAMMDEEGGVREILAIGNDITALKEAEAALMKSEAEQSRQRRFLETLLDTTQSCIAVMTGRELRYTLVNRTYQGLRPDKPMLGRLYREVFPDAVSSGAEALVQRVIETGAPQSDFGYPVSIPGKPDATWDHQIVRLPVEDEQREPSALIITWDSTEHSRARRELSESRERIEASLAEKEILLKEIHHRVKNNMQVISSLLSLQTDIMEDAATRDILRDISHRVRSMALVHEKLYQTTDLVNLEFADYAQSLLDYLWRAHATQALPVKLVTDFDQVRLTVNVAVPCGLILNELVSNALKHAFKGRKRGLVTVSLRNDGQDRIRLRVRDDGIGLPQGADWRQATTLGLRLVQVLTRQLHGTVEAATDSGTEFTLSFQRSKS